MKERGGPHYVGQQMAFLSPQGDFSLSQKQTLSDGSVGLGGGPSKTLTGGATLQSNSHFMISGTSSSIHANNSLTGASSQNSHQQNQLRKKNLTSQTGSEQRQLNLAEMVRGSNIMKPPSFPKNANGSGSDFIKGTQVHKDFQLVAEPLAISKINGNIGNSNQLLVKGGSTSSQNINSHAAIMAVNGIMGGGGALSEQPQSHQSHNHYSQNSSRKNLESYYTTSTAHSKASQQLIESGSGEQNQALQQLLFQQSQQSAHQQQTYSTNRSVAAKAGQMQIFSNDKYSHLPSSHSNHSTQHAKFQSPGGTKVSGKLPHPHHQQSASQQIENMIDLQNQMRLKSNSGQVSAGGGTSKYTDYLNRFSTSSSIEQTQNLQIKYRDLKNQILEQDNQYFGEEASLQQDLPPSNPKMMAKASHPEKRSPQVHNQPIKSEGLAFGLGISGESMHLEEKSLIKKMGGPLQGNTIEGIGSSNPTSQRQIGGGYPKRADNIASLNGRGIQKGGFRTGAGGLGAQIKSIQPRTRYDYVFIRITEELFEKEFADKIIFSRESGDSSPSMLSYNHNRLYSLVGTGPASEKKNNALQYHKAVRSSQDPLNGNGKTSPPLFSPQNSVLTGGKLGKIDDLLQIQTYSNYPGMECARQQPQTPKLTTPAPQPVNTCSIISTNHTHIKVITHQSPVPFSDLSPDEITQQQTMLNDCVQDVMTKVQEKGRVVKTSQKKKYILNSLTPAHLRVASIYVVVLDTASSLYGDNAEMRATLRSESSSNASSNNFNQTLTRLQNAQTINKKKMLPPSQQDSNVARNIRARNNSTINSKNGYDSESEVKSTNSTNTSSTLQFIPTRNFDQASAILNSGVGGVATKSTRSLSQKAPATSSSGVNKPRAAKNNLQKPPAAVPAEDVVTVQRADGKKYPPTKIKIVSPFDQTQHESHRINICLNNYNAFIQLCFRQKGKLNVPAVVKLGRQLGMQINSNMFPDGILKSREQANMFKERLIAYLCKVINEENQPEGMPDTAAVQEAITPLNQPVHQYKCYVGKGNNSILIRTLFKTRFWWLLHDKEEIEKVNFMWTQLRKIPIMDTFPCKFEDKKSGLRTAGGSTSAALQTPGKLKAKKKTNSIVMNSSVSLDSSGGGGGGGNTNSNDKRESKVEQLAAQAAPFQQLSVKLYNKLEDNFHLSNKKAMFLNLRLYYEALGKDVFNAVPMTFHVKEGLEDPEFLRFKQHYFKEEDEIKKQKQQKLLEKQALTAGVPGVNGDDQDGSTPGGSTAAGGMPPQSIKRNIWIIKPGENTNRGQGITVMKEFEEIKAIIQESTANKKRTCIVQKYIHNPLLINKRKFDIRLYAFLSSVNGNIKGYFYQDGYLRTSCREFTLANLANRMIHLTNDAVQKHAEDYGKYEAGNKLSYTDFQNYLDKNYADLNICFERDLLPQMKRLVTDMFRAVYGKIDPKRRINTVEIYGYDFMFDEDFKVYLIEVNTNPCLELGCPLLARLIPAMVENALRLTVDPLFPPPENWSQKKCVVNDVCPENKFELIFDERTDGPYLTELMKEKNNIIIEIDEEELSDNDDVNEKDECDMV